nr:hypothetical protein [Nitrosomonas nitrosa]
MYPALRQHLEDDERITKSLVEHHVVHVDGVESTVDLQNDRS